MNGPDGIPLLRFPQVPRRHIGGRGSEQRVDAVVDELLARGPQSSVEVGGEQPCSTNRSTASRGVFAQVRVFIARKQTSS